MSKRLLVTLALAAVMTATLSIAGASAGDAPKLDPGQFGQTLVAALPAPVDDPAAPSGFFSVKPQEFDPAKTGLVQAAWLDGMGCPTHATIAVPNASFTGVGGSAPYADSGCPTTDPKDQHFEGLLLGKTGPSSNFASATAELNRVKGITLTELGWDIRKAGGTGASPLGSHCGAGAPRWDIQTTTNFYFIGCNSPPGVAEAASSGWVRLRWGGGPWDGDGLLRHLHALHTATRYGHGAPDSDRVRRRAGRRTRLFRRRVPGQHRRQRRARRPRRNGRQLVEARHL